jgi:hypothetical protein
VRRHNKRASGEHASQELAPADIFDKFHDRPPFRAPAAVLIAARMR